MSDFSDKVSELLSNPELLGKLITIAKNFDSSSQTQSSENAKQSTADSLEVFKPTESTAASEAQSDSSVSAMSSALSALGGLGGLANFGGSGGIGDERTALLSALRPFMADRRKQRIDSIIKAVSITSTINKLRG